MNKSIFLIGILVGVILIILFTDEGVMTGNVVKESDSIKVYTFEERRENILVGLNLAIEDAKEEGKYKCCIEPACTMCYLGNWIWKDGTCDCDGMIAEGELDKVCPQCKRGIEEGLCKSTKEEECNLDNGFFKKEN
ncbi:hypothetical protein CL621_03670 [archaeon]|nr:hypothetical protein [archaeon]|tara:strand:- start:266 stop:673 length:408 start_codon:yes stop_codon:yes gene_type:complete